MIFFMGVKYLGLSSLFASVLQVLNLAELGIGSAMVFSMYKPIAEDDEEKVCALMNMYRSYYRIIGLVIASVGVVLTPFIPFLIKGDIPSELNIYVLYYLELGATVLSYWLFAYRNCLFYAHQRDDINSKISILSNTFMYLFQLFVLIVIKNYYAYIIVSLFTTIAKNIITGYLSYKSYPQYTPRGKISLSEKQELNKRIRDLFTSKLGMVIVGSADTIVISAFLGLETLALYQNYIFIMNAIIGILTAFYNACTAGIGNSLILETEEKNFMDLKKIAFIVCWISGICMICFLCLYQPFIFLWMGKDGVLPFSIVICLAIYFIIYEINQLLNLYKDAGGLWSKDKFRPLITALANLTMNLIMVKFWGLYGVILSTVLSMVFIGMPWLLYNLFSELFSRKYLLIFLKELLFFIVIDILLALGTFWICSFVRATGIVELLIKLFICLVLPNVGMFAFYHKTDEFKQVIILIGKVIKKDLTFLIK